MSNHLQTVPLWLDTNYMEENLRKGLKDPTIKVQSIDIKEGSSIGDNYACQVLRITVQITKGGEIETLTTIVKVQPDTTLIEVMSKELNLCEIEGRYYSVLQDKLNSIIEKHPNVPKFSPKCYFVDTEKQVVCLEDLKLKGFELQTRNKFLNLEQTELVMDALAALHGASVHLLKTNPELREMFNKTLWGKEPTRPLKLLLKNASLSLEAHADTYGLEEKFTCKLKSLIEDVENGKLAVCDIQEGKLNFFAHGDCWMNNMMFRFNSGVATDVILLDFQIVNYNSFANDFQYFLFSSVEADIILNKLDHLLERYYLKLKEIAPDIPNLSLKQIKDEFFERLFFGYIIGTMFRPFIVAEVPADLDVILKEKGLEDNGFTNPEYISDLKKLMPFFEKHGLFE